MPHTNIDINSLRLYDREGRRVDLVEVTGEDGSTYMKGNVFFQPLSVALYDNQNFYLLKRVETSQPYYGGDILSSTDIIDRNFIYNVAFPNSLRVGQVIRELPSSSVPTPHMAYDAGGMGIGFSPVVVAELDPPHSRVKMSQPANAAGGVDFEALGEYYVFPGENLGDKFVFRWVKKDKNYAMQGWPALVDEAHAVGDYRIYRNKLYKCVVSYVGPYVGNQSMWKEVSVNRDEYGFFSYDVLVDQQNSPYIEKVVEKSVTYSYDHVDFRYPLEFNVAFNPTDEVAYDNVLEVWYVYGDDGTEKKVIELDFYGEGIIEDERLTAWLGNFGIKFNKYDAMILKDYNLKEAMPDWQKINDAMKQMFFNKEQVFPYIGTYRGLANLIALLGFKDILHVKEYWLNKNPQSVYFNRMLLVDISDMLDDGKIQEMSVLEFNRVVKFDAAMRKTGFLALAYEFTSDSGEVDADGIPVVVETSDMTPAEVFYKLYRMRDKLKNEFLPTNVVIRDIIGEFLYFQRVTPKYWFDQTMVYNNEVGEDATISLFPNRILSIHNLQVLYTQKYPTGMTLPVYNFNAGGSDPYESGQRYEMSRMPGLINAIRTYYNEIARHDGYSIDSNYYWEFGDDAETPVGCPVVLEFNTKKLTIGDMSGKRLQDFTFGTDGFTQSRFAVVEHERQLSPAQNQWSEITVEWDVTPGHVYTHNITIGKVVEWPQIVNATHVVGERGTYMTKIYECFVAYTGPYTGFEHNWRQVQEPFMGDIHTYTYTAGINITVTADGITTSLEIDDGEQVTAYDYPGTYSYPKADIAAYLVQKINTGGRPIVATDLGGGVFRLMSSTTDPFSVAGCVNCAVTGDTGDDVALGIVAAINAEVSPPVINAWIGAPGSGKYYVQAVNYDDHYVNMFEAASSYYTLENIDYLNMYEIEWSITRRGGDQPYSFAWRGPLKDLRVIPHILPYAGDYDVSVRVYDFYGGAVMVYEPRLISIMETLPEIVALTKYEDKYSYQLSVMNDVMLQDCGNSEVYDPCILMRNAAAAYGHLKVSLLDWDFYRRNMYSYDVATDSGVMMWDTSLPVPEYVPWIYCNHPMKNDWGVNQKFRLTSQDFGDARIGDLYFWKVENTVFNADFLAGFHMWNPAPFDKVVFGRNVGSPSIPKIKYVCPQYVHVRVATTGNIDLSNVNTIDGVALSDGDAVLVKLQSADEENGVYVANTMGSFFQLTRHPQCDTAYKTANAFVVVSEGTAGANTCWRTLNYTNEPWDGFADKPMEYYRCPYSPNYAAGSPFDYMLALSDTIGAERHPIMGLFSSHVILTGGSPEMRVMHVTARNFEKYAYQYLSYVKNTDASLWPSIPVEAITGSAYTFYEPTWAYSTQLIQSLEAEYPAFRREELFLAAPIMDILNGLTNDVDYFVQNNYMDVDGYVQNGHLPTVVDENYLALTKTKCFPEGHFIPKHALVFFGINNLYAKRQYEWKLVNDVTGEEMVRITGVPFMVWKFNHNSSFRLSVAVQDQKGNKYEKALTNFVHVSPGLQYKTENDVYNARRKNEIDKAGVMYGVGEPPTPPTPLDPPVYIDEGIEFWYVETDPYDDYDLELVVS